MKLEYSVIAIDDQPDAVATIREAAGLYLQNEGFDLTWETCASRAALDKYLTTNSRPDLVLVDHRLGIVFDNKAGPEWASLLRSGPFRYNDILFYGGESARELRESMAKADVDGVFCANRGDVREVLLGIILVHLRRWTEPGAMRGLAVSIATEMDDLLRDVCLDVANHHGSVVKNVIYTKSAERAKKRGEERPRVVAKHVEKDALAALLHEHTEFSAADLARVIHWFSECVPGVDAKKAVEFAERYLRDVILPRNVLAHGTFDVGTQTFVLSEGRTFQITPENCKAFRVTLSGYRKELLEMRKAAAAGKLAFRGN